MTRQNQPREGRVREGRVREGRVREGRVRARRPQLTRPRLSLARSVDSILEASVAGSFSRLGYVVRSRLLPEFTIAPATSLAGQTALITGATSGIGLAVASQLADLGAAVHFLARSQDRAERCRSQLAAIAARAGHDPASISYGLADLASLGSVETFAADFIAAHDRLDLLIHNAGAIYPRYQRAEPWPGQPAPHQPGQFQPNQRQPNQHQAAAGRAGVERTMTAAVLAPFLLTSRLAGLLRQSAPSRVITVSSGGMYTKRLTTGELELAEPSYRGVAAYALAKRAQVVLSAQWAQRLSGTGIAFHAMHPGWVRTPGLASMLPGFSALLGPALRAPSQGADTIIWLATADPALLSSGLFWHDRRPRPVNRRLGAPPDAPGTGAQLWDWVSHLTGTGRTT